jgi:signal transduction histidine kinase
MNRIRALRYLLWLVPSALASWVLLLVFMVGGMSVVVAGLGLVVVPWLVVGVRRWTDLHRRLAGSVLGVPIPARRQPRRGGPRQVVADDGTWRDLGWLVVQVPVGLVLGAVGLFLAATPVLTVFYMLSWWLRPGDDIRHLVAAAPIGDWGIGLGVSLVGYLLAAPLARLHASFTRAMLGRSPVEQLADRVDELTETRAGAVDAHGAELRRIERDLHDGTQARLVAIAMRAGIARQALADDPATAAELLRDVQDDAEAAMGELRTLIRTIYPPILTDRGLAGAMHALAAQSAVPTGVRLDDLGEVPAAVQAAAYFVVAEALTKVAKHSGASVANVTVSRSADRMYVTVTDDGDGGVVEDGGTGIVGVRRRVAALDGAVLVDSPMGGPTSITVELPCGS